MVEWTPASGLNQMAPNDPWRRVVHGPPSMFFDYWAPPIPERSTVDRALIQTWVQPFTLNLERERLEAALARRWDQITPELVWRLLCERNWRARGSGAYLAALRRMAQYAHQIGGHLLRSEHPYAGQGYCVALARFACDVSEQVLTTYLDHYLAQTDLIFDQCAAMGAAAHLDRVRGTRLVERFRLPWARYVVDKDALDLEATVAHVAQQIEVLDQLEQSLGSTGD